MVSMAEFPPPIFTNPTLCERNSQVINGSNTTGILDYRRFSSKELLSQSKSLTYLETLSKPAFLPVDEGVVERVLNSWNSNGFTGIFEEVHKAPEVPPLVATVSLKAYNCFSYINEWKNKNTSNKYTQEDKEQKLQFACHPHTARIAVVLQNKIKVLCLNRPDSNNEILLRDKRIRTVTCLAWRPKAAMSIAVGSNCGVLVWLLDPNFTNKRPGVSATRYLQSSDMTSDVTSISWSNCGKLLACTCKNSTTFWVWNIVSQNATAIQRVGSDLNFTRWSSCGQRLLTTTNTGVFRIWETKTWDCAKWADLNGKCTNACWSSCGSFLLFTVENEPIIYYTQFYQDKNRELIDIGGSGVALKCADLSTYTFLSNEEDIEIGGNITSMVLDPTDSRLAVTFQDGASNQPFVALFHTRTKPQLQLVPCGFINGECDELPSTINFIHGYDKGALLAICWSTENLSLVPLYFNQNLTSPRQNFNNTGINGPASLSTTFHQALGDTTMNHNSSVNNDISIYSIMD